VCAYDDQQHLGETTVAQQQKPFEDFSAMARQTMAQVQGATEQYFGLLQKSMSSSPWASSDLSKRMLNFAQENVAAGFEFAQRLSQAKDFQDFLRIQNEFMQTQMDAFGRGVRDISEASSKAVRDAIEETPRQKP
jgi:phasin